MLPLRRKLYDVTNREAGALPYNLDYAEHIGFWFIKRNVWNDFDFGFWYPKGFELISKRGSFYCSTEWFRISVRWLQPRLFREPFGHRAVYCNLEWKL